MLKSTVLFYLTLCVSAFPLTELIPRDDVSIAACSKPSTLDDILNAGVTCNVSFGKMKTAIDNFKSIGDAQAVRDAGSQLQTDLGVVKEKLDCAPVKPLDADGSGKVFALGKVLAGTADGTLDSVKNAYPRLENMPLIGGLVIQQVTQALEALDSQIGAYNASLLAVLQDQDGKQAISIMKLLDDKYKAILALYKSG